MKNCTINSNKQTYHDIIFSTYSYNPLEFTARVSILFTLLIDSGKIKIIIIINLLYYLINVLLGFSDVFRVDKISCKSKRILQF